VGYEQKTRLLVPRNGKTLQRTGIRILSLHPPPESKDEVPAHVLIRNFETPSVGTTLGKMKKSQCDKNLADPAELKMGCVTCLQGRGGASAQHRHRGKPAFEHGEVYNVNQTGGNIAPLKSNIKSSTIRVRRTSEISLSSTGVET